MSAPLTAELFARAVIASAVSFGDLPALRAVRAADKVGMKKLHLYPASVAIALEVKRPLVDICKILEIEPADVAAARSRDKPVFQAAQKAAREAVSYHLRGLELAARAQPGAAPEEAPRTEPVSISASAPEAEKIDTPPVPTVIVPPAPSPVPRSAPRSTARPATRAMPKAARLVNLGEGVQRIEMRPISERVARLVKQQLDRGADVTFVAECFDRTPEELKAAIDALCVGRAA